MGLTEFRPEMCLWRAQLLWSGAAAASGPVLLVVFKSGFKTSDTHTLSAALRQLRVQFSWSCSNVVSKHLTPTPKP